MGISQLETKKAYENFIKKQKITLIRGQYDANKGKEKGDIEEIFSDNSDDSNIILNPKKRKHRKRVAAVYRRKLTSHICQSSLFVQLFPIVLISLIMQQNSCE